MRLWSQQIIHLLPRQQLLGQHRECAALRGNGWGKPHATVNYVFQYNRLRLFVYHELIMEEMKRRGYNVSPEWLNFNYRGKKCEPDHYTNEDLRKLTIKCQEKGVVYPEHDQAYLKECLENLKEKGIQIENGGVEGL